MKIIKSQPVSEVEAKQLIERELKESEPTYNEELALKHSNQLKISVKKAKELVKKLSEVVPENVAVKVVDVMPASIETLKTLLRPYELVDKAEEVMKVLEEK